MRNKAMQDQHFPDETLIKEFLHRKDNVKQLDLKWKQPNVVNFLVSTLMKDVVTLPVLNNF